MQQSDSFLSQRRIIISMDNIRMASAWNMFVNKVFEEGRMKNKAFSFKEALSEASKRKGEMGSMSATKSKKAPKSKKAKKSTKKTRKARKSRKA